MLQGVVKALFQHGLLPRVLAGSSVGSIGEFSPLSLKNLEQAAGLTLHGLRMIDKLVHCNKIVGVNLVYLYDIAYCFWLCMLGALPLLAMIPSTQDHYLYWHQTGHRNGPASFP